MGLLPSLYLCFLLAICQAKKNEILKSSQDLLEKESERLATDGIRCGVKALTETYTDQLRMLKQTDKAIACYVKYLKENKENGWQWSGLGQCYLDKGTTKSSSMASTCFKQASKLSGKMTPSIKEWYFLGPFIIGKNEVDGDPAQAYGDIKEVAKSRGKNTLFYSEFVEGGEIGWNMVKQTGQESVQISPRINWNDLIGSLGSTAITEWQGWAIAEFAVNDNNLNIMIQCLGVNTVYINDIPVTGDVYRRNQFWFSVNLARGIYTMYVKLRAKGVQSFRCDLGVAKSNFEISTPHYLPDLWDGYLFSQHVALPVSNLHATKWLKLIKVAVQDQWQGKPITAKLLDDRHFAIAPGQTRQVIVQLEAEDDNILEGTKCTNVDLKLKISTSDGQVVYPLSIRCRKRTDSFVFTFVDHDGSVQHGAAIQPIKGCDNDLCPVLLTMHGTTVPAQNQADSYKRMDKGDKDYVFGLNKAWVVAPTRHGAHNWEGPGALTAMTAMERLCDIVEGKPWIQLKASKEHVIIAGHSMGGHGAWQLATHFPDRTLALMPLAGWIKKENYGDSNIFFRHDISVSHIDPSVKHILEASFAENEVDRVVSNLQGISVLARTGSADRTIHPYFVRRMYRILKEWNITVTYVEIPGKEHWWWDTKETNDGGCVNDKQMRDFMNKYSVIKLCDGGPCLPSHGMYAEESQNTQSFTYTVLNPAYGGSMRGLQILQQVVLFRTSRIKGEISAHDVNLEIENVATFTIREPFNRPVGWADKNVKINGQSLEAELIKSVDHENELCLQLIEGKWVVCKEHLGRLPGTLGPARTIAESSFLLVIGTQGTDEITQAIQEMAVYIANLFFLTSDTIAPIVKDKDLNKEKADLYNLIVIGTATENSYTAEYLQKLPVNAENGAISLGSCTYKEPRTGLLTLAPHATQKLALLLLANSLDGLRDVVNLATPTIPPMTRSPFSNQVPDFVITGPKFNARGPGGYECAGFWDNNWQLDPVLMSCSYCA